MDLYPSSAASCSCARDTSRYRRRDDPPRRVPRCNLGTPSSSISKSWPTSRATADAPRRPARHPTARRPARPRAAPSRLLGHSREHPLTLSLDPPATIRLFGGLRVVELKTIDQRPAGLLVDRRDRVDQLLDPGRTSLTVSCVAAAPNIGVESRSAPPARPTSPTPPRDATCSQAPGAPCRATTTGRGTSSTRRMPAPVIDRQPERDLPAQIPRHRLHRLLISSPHRYANNNTFANTDGGIDGDPPLRIALREVPSHTIRSPCQPTTQTTTLRQRAHNPAASRPQLTRSSRNTKQTPTTRLSGSSSQPGRPAAGRAGSARHGHQH